MTRIKPILRWPGGKTRLLPSILPLIRPHKLYAEGFAGGLATLLAKPPSAAEVINDINEDLVNLYRYAQFHLDALIHEVEFTLASRADLAALVEQPGLTGLQRAARFLLRNRLSFGGGGTSYAVSKRPQPSRAAVLELLRAFNARLDKVSVENLPYERLFKNYDSPETLWFLDPPYSAGEVDAYEAWTDVTMAEFAARVEQLAGDWIVTVNDCPKNRALFARHEITPVVTNSGAVNRKSLPKATFGELIVRRRLGRAAVPVRRAPAAALKLAA
ncbi:MAG: DNA adenine methylase [Prosthecobacter sp.]